jgi:hypothetical protein
LSRDDIERIFLPAVGRTLDAPIKELKKYGLQPVFSTAGMPQKLFYTIGLVISMKAS